MARGPVCGPGLPPVLGLRGVAIIVRDDLRPQRPALPQPVRLAHAATTTAAHAASTWAEQGGLEGGLAPPLPRPRAKVTCVMCPRPFRSLAGLSPGQPSVGCPGELALVSKPGEEFGNRYRVSALSRPDLRSPERAWPRTAPALPAFISFLTVNDSNRAGPRCW